MFLNPQSNGLSEALVHVDRVPTKDCVIWSNPQNPILPLTNLQPSFKSLSQFRVTTTLESFTLKVKARTTSLYWHYFSPAHVPCPLSHVRVTQPPLHSLNTLCKTCHLFFSLLIVPWMVSLFPPESKLLVQCCDPSTYQNARGGW